MRVSTHTLAIGLRAIEESLALLPPTSPRRTALIVAASEIRFVLEALKVDVRESTDGQ
jgi:hypothetical protein